jgi:hypothetical protein
MLKNPPRDDKSRNNVQKNPLVNNVKRKIIQEKFVIVAPRKCGQKADSELANAPLKI